MTTAIEDIIAGTPIDGLEMRIMQPEGRANPYPVYARLRSEDPVHWSSLGIWFLTRHDDVAMLRDARFAQGLPERRAELAKARAESSVTPLDRIFSGAMLVQDPPDHTRLRKLVNHAFTPRRVEALRDRIQAIVDALLDGRQARGEMDVIADLAYPLPITVICELLGIPSGDRARFREWSRALAPVLDITTPEIVERANVAAGEMIEYFVPLIDERRRRPGEDLLSALIQAEQEGEALTADEVLANLVLVFFAGHETTVNLIGNGTLALLRNRDQWDLLRADPSLARNAVEEVLRYDSPVQLTSRTALEDVELGGKRIERGQEVTFVLGAANRDPEVFQDPDRLDVTRRDVHHLSFGGGIHFCVGAPLARLEGQVAFETLVRRLPDLRLQTEDPPWRDTLVLHGLQSLPVAF